MILYEKEVKIFGEHQTIKITPLTLLVLLSILLRIPSLFEPYWYGDEAIYLTLGEGIRHGLVLYRDIFDHKTPLIYLIAAAAGSLFWFKFILLVWHCLTIVLFWKLSENFFEKRIKPVFWSCLIFTLLTTLPLIEGNIVNSELLILGPTIGAFLLLSDPAKVTIRRTFLAGLLFSISILLKVPGVFDLFTILLFWVFSIRTRRGFGRILAFSFPLGLGVILPILISALYFLTQGALGAYISTAWFANFNYISRWGAASTLSTVPAVTNSGLALRALVTGLVLGVVFLVRKIVTPTVLFTLIWLVLSLFAALLSARPYPHYLIQTVPALSIAIAVVCFGRMRERFVPIPFLILFSYLLVFYKFSYYPVFSYYSNFLQFVSHQKTKDEYFKAYDARVPRTYALARALDLRTRPDEPVFIWGTGPEVYALSRRIPPTRYITSFHIGDFGGERETIQELNKNKPAYIIILPEETRTLAGLLELLQKDYIYIENIEGAEVWKLIDPALKRLIK